MEIEIRVWRNLPSEIVLDIIARLLPRRSLVRFRTVWKAWNEMLSSYAAMQKIYPNIHLSYSSAFLFQFRSDEHYGLHTWVMEGSGDLYKVSNYSDRIEIARNTMFCLRYPYHYDDYYIFDNEFDICDEKSRDRKCITDNKFDIRFIGKAFDSSTDQFIMVLGGSLELVYVYDSSCDSWAYRELSLEGSVIRFRVSGTGVYHRGRFYWLDQNSLNGGIVELNLSERSWTKISPPQDSVCRYLDNTNDDLLDEDSDEFPTVASVYWNLAGNDVGQLILVDRECGIMWKLENEEENRWCRVDICLPKKIRLTSVTNSGWIAVVGEEINVYDGSRRLVRKFAMDEVDPELASSIKKLNDLETNDLFPSFSWTLLNAPTYGGHG